MQIRSGSGLWVLITGASYGIGEVFARRFAQEGWNTVLVARSVDKLEALAKTLEHENGTRTLVIAADLTRRESPGDIYGRIGQEGIEIEGLVNNAGYGFGGRFVEVPLEHYLGMIDLNVRALVELTRLFLPQMIERRRGFILNVSSTAAYQPLPFSSVYAASKSFVSSFTEGLWLETKGTGVRVLNLCPGLTKTDFGKHANLRDFRRDPMAESPEQVVETAFRALKRSEPTVISGWRNKLLIFLEGLIPKRILFGLILLVQKSRGHV